MATEIKLPELGEGVESADVAAIHVKEGDTIEANQNVLELETEKAVLDLPSPKGGKVLKIHVAIGDSLKIGQTVLSIEESAPAGGKPTAAPAKPAAQAPQQKTAPAAPSRPAAPAVTSSSAAHSPSVATNGVKKLPPPAGPSTRRLARKLGINLELIRGSGEPGGRITQEDVVRAYTTSQIGSQRSASALPPLPDFSKFGPVDREPLNKIAKTAAERMSASWPIIPQVTQHGLADITEVEAHRKSHNQTADSSAAKITLTAIAIKTVVTALKEFPKFNSSLDWGTKDVIMKRFYHIGVAVDTEHGLFVPVIRDADKKSIVELAKELGEVADRARNKRLGIDEMQGGTFTISNQGNLGGTYFSPIINYPEVAILGLSQSNLQLKLNEGQIEQRLMMPMSLSYDHRVINGAEAARFISRLGVLFSDSFELLFKA